MSDLNTAFPSARSCITFGCLTPMPDVSGRPHAPDEVVTGAARYPLPDSFTETVQQPSDVMLLSAESPTPLAAFCVPSGRIRAYFIFNPLDPASRQLLQRSTEEGELQMLLWDWAGQQLGFGLRGELFAEVLRSTAGRNASDFETWIAHALSVAPELPAAFAPHLPGTDGEDSRHCAVVMLPRERLDHITRAYTSH